MNGPEFVPASRYQDGHVVAADPDPALINLGAAEQELCATQAIPNDPSEDELVRIVDAVRQQAGVGGGVGLIGEALTAVHQRQDDVATSVVPVRNVVDAAISRHLEQGRERPYPLRHAEKAEDAVGAAAREPSTVHLEMLAGMPR